MNLLDCIPKIAKLCHEASLAILYYYAHRDQLNIQNKSNNTPVTQADLIADQILTAGLPQIIDIPVISEEGKQFPDNHCNDYWLIDPIDGTNAFIAHTDQFCIAIARIQNDQPILGIIYSPTTHEYWYSVKNQGSYKVDKQQHIFRLTQSETKQPFTLILPHRKISKYMTSYINQNFNNPCLSTCSSALKFCLLAENKGQIYPKLSATTCEWDTAAGHLLLQEIGGGITYYQQPDFLYGKRKTFINPPFIAYNHAISQKNIADWQLFIQKTTNTCHMQS